MSSAKQYTDPYLSTYRQVPQSGPGVCSVCHSGTGEGFPTCFSCYQTMGQVTHPTSNVIPISLYKTNDQLWHVLRYYKDGSPAARPLLETQVAAMIVRFTGLHMECIGRILGGPPSVVTTVPSTRSDRPGVHPLVAAVRRCSNLVDLYQPLLVRGSGAVDHNKASDDAFRVDAHVNNSRVLLIEDTFTSGARAQSAASALRLVGAANVVVLTVGRVIKPDWNENCQRIWNEASNTIFDFSRCCLFH
jgi:hypothetical protein